MKNPSRISAATGNFLKSIYEFEKTHRAAPYFGRIEGLEVWVMHEHEDKYNGSFRVGDGSSSEFRKLKDLSCELHRAIMENESHYGFCNGQGMLDLIVGAINDYADVHPECQSSRVFAEMIFRDMPAFANYLIADQARPD